MLGLGEFPWSKVETTSNGSTFAWSWQQQVVTMPRFPSSTLLVTKTAIRMILPHIFWLLLVMNPTLAFPHINGDIKQAKCLSNTI